MIMVLLRHSSRLRRHKDPRERHMEASNSIKHTKNEENSLQTFWKSRKLDFMYESGPSNQNSI